MSFRRRLTLGAASTTGDGNGRPIFFSAAVARVEGLHPPAEGWLAEVEEYEAEGSVFQRVYVTQGRLRGFKVEFVRSTKQPEIAKLRVVRYSTLYWMLFVVLGVVPGVLAFVGMFIARVRSDTGEPHYIAILLGTALVVLVGAGSASLLSGTVSRVFGKALSNSELDAIGNAVVDAVRERDPSTRCE